MLNVGSLPSLSPYSVISGHTCTHSKDMKSNSLYDSPREYIVYVIYFTSCHLSTGFV